jgi:ATP-dependent protease ClpP protease subunit
LHEQFKEDALDIEIFDLLTDWKKRVNEHQKANIALADKFTNYHYWIGLPATILTAIASAALLVEAEESQIKLAIGIVGIIAAILTAFQTFSSYAKRAENHRLLVSQLVHLRRDIDIFEKFIPEKKTEREQRIREINDGISEIEKGAQKIEALAIVKKWPWVLVSLVGALALIFLLALGSEWLGQIPTAQRSVEYWVRESVQQGTETWEFDAYDPLIKKRTILVNTWINEIVTQKVITLLTYFNERDSESPITIYLSSTGGYTKDAFAIVHAIQESEAKVDTIAIGDCFSACTVILMSGTGERKIAQNSRIAVHTHSYPFDSDPYSYNTVLFEREKEYFQKFSTIPADWLNGREEFYYLSPEQAITFHIADEIIE